MALKLLTKEAYKAVTEAVPNVEPDSEVWQRPGTNGWYGKVAQRAVRLRRKKVNGKFVHQVPIQGYGSFRYSEWDDAIDKIPDDTTYSIDVTHPGWFGTRRLKKDKEQVLETLVKGYRFHYQFYGWAEISDELAKMIKESDKQVRAKREKAAENYAKKLERDARRAEREARAAQMSDEEMDVAEAFDVLKKAGVKVIICKDK